MLYIDRLEEATFVSAKEQPDEGGWRRGDKQTNAIKWVLALLILLVVLTDSRLVGVVKRKSH